MFLAKSNNIFVKIQNVQIAKCICSNFRRNVRGVQPAPQAVHHQWHECGVSFFLGGMSCFLGAVNFWDFFWGEGVSFIWRGEFFGTGGFFWDGWVFLEGWFFLGWVVFFRDGWVVVHWLLESDCSGWLTFALDDLMKKRHSIVSPPPTSSPPPASSSSSSPPPSPGSLSPAAWTATMPGSPSYFKTTQIWSTGKLLNNDDSLMLPMNMTEGYLSCELILKICFVKVWLLPQFPWLWIMFFDYLVLARKLCFDLNWLLDIVPSPSRFLIELSISMTSYFNNLLFCKRKMVERKYKVSYK